MNTNNSSDKNRIQNLEKDANENANESRNLNDPQNADNNRMQNTENSKAPGSGDYRSGKGTGMSSEAGATQTERSWQDLGGGNANQQRNEGNDYGNQSMKNVVNSSTTGMQDGSNSGGSQNENTTKMSSDKKSNSNDNDDRSMNDNKWNKSGSQK